jgi:hypothetical protein
MPAIFSLIWSALTSKIAGPIATAAAIALAIALAASGIKAAATEAVLRHDAVSAQAAQAVAVRDLGTCHASLTNETAALDAQGAAVAALKSESDTRTAAASVALQQARSATAALSKREAAIAVEKPTADLCASADGLILEDAK